MVKFFTFILSFLFLISCSNNPTQQISIKDSTTQAVVIKDTSNYTAVQWFNEKTKFKEQKEGAVIEMAFEFQNIGSQPLIIEQVRPSCGCTVAEYPKAPFAPNQKGKITIKYNSKDRGKGLIQKSVVVFGNFSNSPKVLSFEGIIK